MAVEIANFIQAVATVVVNSSSSYYLAGSAGVASLRRDAEGEFTLLLEQPLDCEAGSPSKYRAGVIINDMRPLGAGSCRAVPVPINAEEAPDTTPGSIKLLAYDDEGEPADSLAVTVIVCSFPVKEG